MSSEKSLHGQLNSVLADVTDRIRIRSVDSRAAYLRGLAQASNAKMTHRGRLSCTNLAHAFAVAPGKDKLMLREMRQPNIGIVSAYNDMLSAHQPLGAYPEWIKAAVREVGATAQFAGGVPAMCDGVTQGQPGMELSLFSRDVIAMATAVALSHNVFDGVLCLGVCDKIVPGLLIGALRFGHLPCIFVPGGPMTSGMSNSEKSRMRQLHAAGEIDDAALLEAESQSYHGAGTCTFYGTANSNQMLMEVMGLHLPGTAFVPTQTPLREALTRASARRVVDLVNGGSNYTALGHVLDERAIANGIVGLMATGGSTNHTMHLVAIARAAGIHITWDDFSDLSAAVPLVARVYPNGKADVNDFHAAGGTPYLIHTLLEAGLLHGDVRTVAGEGLAHYACMPKLEQGKLVWERITQSRNTEVLTSTAQPFSEDGGLRVLDGNLGRAVIKVSAVRPEHRVIEAPAVVFESQEALLEAYHQEKLNHDFVAVVRYQGPRANGMPELHALTPALANLQDKGFHVALVTDGRMSGASGKVPAAIHVTPEALAGRELARVQDGDMIRLDAEAGILLLCVSDEELAQRTVALPDLSANTQGMGRELFASMRYHVGSAEAGALTFSLE